MESRPWPGDARRQQPQSLGIIGGGLEPRRAGRLPPLTSRRGRKRRGHPRADRREGRSDSARPSRPARRFPATARPARAIESPNPLLASLRPVLSCLVVAGFAGKSEAGGDLVAGRRHAGPAERPAHGAQPPRRSPQLGPGHGIGVGGSRGCGQRGAVRGIGRGRFTLRLADLIPPLAMDGGRLAVALPGLEGGQPIVGVEQVGIELQRPAVVARRRPASRHCAP